MCAENPQPLFPGERRYFYPEFPLLSSVFGIDGKPIGRKIIIKASGAKEIDLIGLPGSGKTTLKNELIIILSKLGLESVTMEYGKILDKFKQERGITDTLNFKDHDWILLNQRLWKIKRRIMHGLRENQVLIAEMPFYGPGDRGRSLVIREMIRERDAWEKGQRLFLSMCPAPGLLEFAAEVRGYLRETLNPDVDILRERYGLTTTHDLREVQDRVRKMGPPRNIEVLQRKIEEQLLTTDTSQDFDSIRIPDYLEMDFRRQCPERVARWRYLWKSTAVLMKEVMDYYNLDESGIIVMNPFMPNVPRRLE